MFENIRLSTSVFCVVGDYFYTMLPSPTNLMMKRTNQGDPVTTYPFSHEVTPNTGVFLSMAFDGVNFWTLEKGPKSTTPPTYDYTNSKRIIRRWRIENFVCELKDSWILQSSAGENMNGSAFCIEHYTDTLFEEAPATANHLHLSTPTACYFHNPDKIYIEHATDNSIHEDTYFSSQDPSSPYIVNLPYGLTNTYPAGSKVHHYRKLYFFNNEAPTYGASSAALYSISITQMDNNPTPLTCHEGDTWIRIYDCHTSGVYESTAAATFATVSGITPINDGYYTGLIMYSRGTQLLFKKPNLPSDTWGYPDGITPTDNEFEGNVASMLMDGVMKTDNVNLNTVYALDTSATVDTNLATNIYRLQLSYTIAAQQGTWTTYNFIVSVMEPMITSITMTVEPAVMAANDIDQAHIWCVVRDQYDAPVNGKWVTVEASQSQAAGGGFVCPQDITGTPCSTNPSDPCFRFLGSQITARWYEAQIKTGCQDIYGRGFLDGTVVLNWRVGMSAGYPSIVATVRQ